MDRQLGRLIETIDELGLGGSTLILLTSDNGPTDWPRYYDAGHEPPGFTGPFFGRKWSLYEGGIRMPLIVRWPGTVPAGAVDDRSVMAAMDLRPTIAALVDVKLDSGPTDGLDRSQAILGKPLERETPLFWEYGVHGSIQPGNVDHVSPALAMRLGKWKLLCNPDGSQMRLFDLAQDPGEQFNLAEGQPQVVEQMSPLVFQWWDEMNAYYQ